VSAPHGGALVNRTLSESEATEARALARELPKLALSPSELNDLELIANGAFSPLEGFMCKTDYDRVVDEMRLADGLVWTIPVTLSMDALPALRTPRNARNDKIALYDDADLRAILHVADVFRRDKQRELHNVYGTTDEAHPGAARVLAQSDHIAGGRISYLPKRGGDEELRLTPQETRAEFARRNWKSIVAFQTRNPIHRAHEYIQKCALETVDGLFVHPLVGETKADDVPAGVRIACYKALLENYYPPERVVLSLLPAAMRYAGPREAIFHALIRKNYGCTHFIVGRDHAGVGNYYGTYDAQRLFDAFSFDELGIVPLKFENSFYCRRCESMASRKTCSHDSAHHVALSGSAVRAMLRSGELPPPEYSRPEVAKILLG
jgi:sulfate adenylyltransferase